MNLWAWILGALFAAIPIGTATIGPDIPPSTPLGTSSPSPLAVPPEIASSSIPIITPSSPETEGTIDELQDKVLRPALPEFFPDATDMRKIIASYRSGDLVEAEGLGSKLSDPAAAGLAEWFAIRSGIAVTPERVLSFKKRFPDWPVTAPMRRKAEEALLTGRRSQELVSAFFAGQEPVTAAGRIALALTLKASRNDAKANDLVRKIWREDAIGLLMESKLLDEFPGTLSKADHRARMERFLFRENGATALRAAQRAGPGFSALVQARLAMNAGKKKAEKAFAAVPAELRDDPSFLFSRASYLRRSNQLDEAAQIMGQSSRDPDLLVDTQEWWNERRLLARALLDKGNVKSAYDLVAQHGARNPADLIEAEFHAGWIALRFLKDAPRAKEHFAKASEIATTPISIARATYWQGRAFEFAENLDAAAPFYRRAAEQPITFYGQLAADKLHLPPAELREPAVLDPERQNAFESKVPVRALGLLSTLNEPDLTISLYADIAQATNDPSELAALATMAERQNDPRAALTVGKTAVQRGLPLDIHAYPIFGLPPFEPVNNDIEQAMVFAIARQESAFNAKAVSSAGARGLMQLMPATAKRTATRFKLGFDVERLIDDPAYNAKVGTAHLSELMADWKGSHILTFASYNAGGGNVSKWIKAYGDPRNAAIDWVDWVERIPFSETRNYVQRVMENLNVYRRRLNASLTTAPERKLDKSAAQN